VGLDRCGRPVNMSQRLTVSLCRARSLGLKYRI
jgi:hypothetical protein